MVDKLNSINSIVNIIRNQSSKSAKRGEKAKRGDKKVASRAKGTASATELEAKILKRIESLEGDEHRHERILKIIVESILSWEFGEQAMADPKFHQLVSTIQADLKSVDIIKSYINDLA